MRYEDRVLAYIDILGFKEKIKKTINKDLETEEEYKTEEIYNLFDDDVHELKNKQGMFLKRAESKVVSHFSDSIAVSYSLKEEAGINKILFDIFFFCHNLLLKGFLLRGAIVCGKLHHTSEKIFGPAMIAAVDMEKDLAIYPQIILGDDILVTAEKFPPSRISKKTQKDVQNNLVSKDFDGLKYLNYFDGIDFFYGKEYGVPEYFKALKDCICELKKDIMNDNRKKGKYLWLVEKYNKALKRYKRKYDNDETKRDSQKIYDCLKNLTELSGYEVQG